MPKSKPHRSAPKPVPQFASEDAERAFWAKHGVSDYFDWSRAVLARFPNLRPTTTTISIRLPEPMIEDFKKYLKPNDTYQVLVYGEEAVGIRFPKKVWLKVTEAEEGAKGNTATGATKTVIVETGAVVTVPLFIKHGDVIGIDPETNSYLERE